MKVQRVRAEQTVARVRPASGSWSLGLIDRGQVSHIAAVVPQKWILEI